MKTLAKVMMIALVLGVMVLAPSMANATPARATMVGLERSQNLHILDLFFQMLGFKTDTDTARHDSHATSGGTSQPALPMTGGSTSGTISTDGAIWGCGRTHTC
jgi:hypothetical protein